MANEVAVKHTHDTVLQPRNFGELMQFGKIAASSGMVPRDFVNKPEAVIIAVQMGAELGLSPMQSIQNISVINGRPSVWGDALLALVQNSPLCRDVHETIEGEGDAMTAICTVKRKGRSDVEARFSVADARKAGLWTKTGPWQQYPRRMLQMRARGFALRDAFPDVLRGLITVEEAQDYPVIEHKQAPRQKVAEPAPEIVDVQQAEREEEPEIQSEEEKVAEWAEKVMEKIASKGTSDEVKKVISTKSYLETTDKYRDKFPEIINGLFKFAATTVRALTAQENQSQAPEPEEIEAFPEGEAA